jgi:hypothetical protein
MKKTTLVLSIAAAATLTFTGCADKSANVSKEEQAKRAMIEANNNLPSWVLNPQVEGGISAVGIAGYSKHGMQVMLPQAEMDARAKLAGQIQTEISRIQKQAMRHNKINDLDDFENVFKQATKEVVKKIPLSGARKVKQYQAPDGTLYVLMVIEKRDVANEVKDMKDTYLEHMKQAKMTRESLDQGMKVLDDMMKELEEETK